MGAQGSSPDVVGAYWQIMLVGYVVIRTASFHYVDRLIGEKFLGLRLNWILEMGGIGVVLVASYWRQSKIKKSKPGLLQRS